MARRITSDTASRLLYEIGSGAFARDAALEVVSAQNLRSAIRAGTVVRMRHGVYRVADGLDSHTEYVRRINAELMRHTSCVAGFESAAALLEMSNPHFGRDWTDLPVRLINRVGWSRSGHAEPSPGVRVSYRGVPEEEVVLTPHGPCTSPLITAIDLAEQLPWRLGLTAMDEAFTRKLTQWYPELSRRVAVQQTEMREEVRTRAWDLLNERPRHKGVRNARWAIANADPASESPGESLSRAWVIRRGLPTPIVNAPIYLPDGRLVFPDMRWDDERVVGEVDGAGKYTADAEAGQEVAAATRALFRERARESRLQEMGLSVVRWGVSEMLRQPEMVLARIYRALRR